MYASPAMQIQNQLDEMTLLVSKDLRSRKQKSIYGVRSSIIKTAKDQFLIEMRTDQNSICQPDDLLTTQRTKNIGYQNSILTI